MLHVWSKLHNIAEIQGAGFSEFTYKMCVVNDVQLMSEFMVFFMVPIKLAIGPDVILDCL